MAVKVFCNCCQEYIKDCKPNEMSSLRGNEICSSCEAKVNSALKAVEDAMKKSIVHIQQVGGKAIAELDEMKRRVIEGGADGKDA
jgi:acetylglutamate kinase